ncbi:MAG: hypothetical protein ACU85V_01305 [Gammaproteobacteria bacterium]
MPLLGSLLFAAAVEVTAAQAPPPEFRSVSNAYKALIARPGATVRRRDGWTRIGFEHADGSRTVWSFVPPGHAAYPALVRRDIGVTNGRQTIETTLQCEATRVACDALFEDLEAEDRALGEMAAQP